MIAGWWLIACLGGGPSQPEAPALLADHGVDVAAKRIRVGALNDESGPAKAIGQPLAVGKRVLVARVNGGGTGWLPDGWTVELIERDHGYSPEEARRALAEIEDEVLFVATSLGTEQTLALNDRLAAADLVAFPASLATALHGNALTPPLGASYEAEARRAVDFHVVEADGRATRIAVVHRPDAFGSDVVRGVTEATRSYGLGEPLVLPSRGPEDAPAIAARLTGEDVTHVVLGTLPPLTLALLRDAVARGSAIVWVGTSPAWSDAFARLPEATELLARYHQTSSLPWWGEELPGMDEFEAAFAAHGGGASPDAYVLAAYATGIVQLEAAREAIEAGDVTRAGYRRALGRMHEVDAGGMLIGFDLSRLPGPVTDRVRILKPTPGAGPVRFSEVLPLERPGPRRERPGQAALDDEASAGRNPGEDAGELESP